MEKLKDISKKREAEIFKHMVNLGFDPIRFYIQQKNLSEDLTDEDIELLVNSIGMSLIQWCKWLRHEKMHIFGRGHDNEY